MKITEQLRYENRDRATHEVRGNFTIQNNNSMDLLKAYLQEEYLMDPHLSSKQVVVYMNYRSNVTAEQKPIIVPYLTQFPKRVKIENVAYIFRNDHGCKLEFRDFPHRFIGLERSSFYTPGVKSTSLECSITFENKSAHKGYGRIRDTVDEIIRKAFEIPVSVLTSYR